MKNKKIFIKIFISLFIICLLCLGITSSKYYNSFLLLYNADIANPIFKVEDNNSALITANNNIGEYEFNVKNFDNNIKSDVPFEYTIEIISNTDEQIEYTLYKDGKVINLNQNKTDKIFLSNTDNIIHKFCLEIKYNGSISNDNKDIFQNVQIKINAEQK